MPAVECVHFDCPLSYICHLRPACIIFICWTSLFLPIKHTSLLNSTRCGFLLTLSLSPRVTSLLHICIFVAGQYALRKNIFTPVNHHRIIAFNFNRKQQRRQVGVSVHAQHTLHLNGRVWTVRCWSNTKFWQTTTQGSWDGSYVCESGAAPVSFFQNWNSENGDGYHTLNTL